MNSAIAYTPTPPSSLTSGVPTAAYLHIPFCRRRCYYCDFPVSVVGDRKNGENSGTIQQYVEMLLQEVCTTSATCQPLLRSKSLPLETIFFGGGTPSLLSAGQIRRILEALEQEFGLAAGAEISMEMDPGTFTLEQLEGYRTAGVNRVSLGVQAFQDELLGVCGRSHTVSDILEAVEMLRQVDFHNFSIDLISGLPHQNLDLWKASLEAAVAISPAHISSYDLIVEQNTAFNRYYQAGVQPLPGDEMAAQMYRLAQQILTSAGYEHYEISNYAKPGYQCRHNRVYWQNRPYFGFGMGATSYVQGRRFTRPRKTWEYYEWLHSEGAKQNGASEIEDAGTECFQDILLETLMLGLRLAEGLSLSGLAEKFGTGTLEKILTCLQPYHRQGWVEILNPDGVPSAVSLGQNPPAFGQLRLSDPEGFLFSNTILASLFRQFSS
ncbi:radical SAM family heme chaperone HemW [Microcoleus sp. FACHB-68]|uniref:radical SAM family heme chaperone HemW n=1 Tax=Microcoleus sp. FACHB-68 TaxID=2692826 RepID=UPI001686CAAD|nr:radical SAM family heme chaperone HemW [Microcoleus sp. FACHB-68]MBD1936630.1 coproporphyrinogen III oxidase [Microcoleus sp. FACHB-68]